MSLTKRLLSGILFFVLILPSNIDNAEAAAFPRFGESISYGRGVWSAETHSPAVCYDANSNPELTYGVQGGYFYSIDLNSGAVRFKTILNSSYINCYAQATGSDGNVYFKSYPETGLRMYNPITKTISDCTDFQSDGNFAMAMHGGCDGKLHISTYDPKGARIFEYDIYNKTTIDLGIMKDGAHYIQGLEVTSRYVYAGVGMGTNIQACIRYDRQTGEKEEIFGQNGGSTFYQIIVTQGKIFALQYSNILVFDEETLELIDLYSNSGRVFISEPSPVNSNLIYNIVDNSIYEYNMVTKEHRMVCDNPLKNFNIHEIKGLQWFQNINGEWLLSFHSNFMGYIGYFNPQTGICSVMQTSEVADMGPQIQSLEISPKGILHMGGYQTGTSAFDIKNESFLFNIQEFHQPEGIGFLNGKTYYGTYTDAVIFRYDPDKPLNYLGYNYDRNYQPDGNPGMVYDIQDGQDRPFVIKSYKDKLYVGTISSYAQLGGALVIYEEDEERNPHACTYRNVIQNQGITGIACKDDKVYLSSTIRGGLGIDPVETQAKIAVFDEKTKTVINTVIPDVPGIGTASQTIGEISFGPDGLLWACSELEGTVFAMDPETFEVIKYVKTNAGKNLGSLTRPLYLRWGDDGNLYTTAGWNVSVINPKTMEYKTLINNCSLMTLDPNGNIWYAKGAGFSKIPINQWDRLQNILLRAKQFEELNYSSDSFDALRQSINYAEGLKENSSVDLLIAASERLNKSITELWYISDIVENYTIQIQEEKQAIEVSGTLKKTDKLNLTLKCISPVGTIIYLNEFNANNNGSFEKTFAIDPLKKGIYTVNLFHSSFEKPIIRTVQSIDNGKMPSFTLGVDYLNSTVKVNSTLYDVDDKRLTMKAEDSNGEILYLSEILADRFGRYEYQYRLNPITDGIHRLSLYSSYYDQKKVKDIEITCPKSQYLAESYIELNEETNDLKCGAKLTNYYSVSKNIMLIVAIYDASTEGIETATSVITKTKSLDPFGYGALEIKLNNINNNTGRIVKVFLWEDNLIPILTVKSKEM